MPRSNPEKSASKKKLSKKERDEHFAARLPGILNYHATMLTDGLRNKLLYKAIKRAVSQETSFLDVGAGTGVWAILAAKLGAKRVVAVEMEECLIPLIYRHAVENGVADRIEIVHGHSRDLRLRGRFDVIVSELFGNDALGRESVEAFIDVRDRFLANGGVLIPQKLWMMAVPARINDIAAQPRSLPITTRMFQQLRFNYGWTIPLESRTKPKLLAEAKALAEIDFRTVTTAPKLDTLSARWRLRNISRANAIVTFNVSQLSPKIRLDAFNSPSWSVGACAFPPFEAGAGEIVFRAAASGETGNWSVECNSAELSARRSFSPIFAYAKMRSLQNAVPKPSVKTARPR